jgi:hypothetical protein
MTGDGTYQCPGATCGYIYDPSFTHFLSPPVACG